MGLRNKNTTTSKKLTLNKETLRRLQLRGMTEEELRAAVGGWNTGACDGAAPSHCRC